MNRSLYLLAAVLLLVVGSVQASPQAAAPAGDLLTAVRPPDAGIPITNSTVITAPGTYYLATPLSNLDVPVAISIRSSNVTLDGRHHRVDGRGLAGTVGIELRPPEGAPALANVLVTDVRLSGWETGLLVAPASGAEPGTGLRATGVRATGNGVGLQLWGPGDVALANCTADANTNDGIRADGITGDLTLALANVLVQANGDDGIDGRLTRFTLDGCSVLENGGDAEDSGFALYKGVATIRSCAFERNRGAGLSFLGSTGGTVTGSRFVENGFAGIRDAESSGEGGSVTVYDNYLLNDLNVVLGDRAGTWSVPKTAGPNVIGGASVGGNFWAGPNGTGFSQTHPDLDGDGFCDQAFVLGTGAVDSLPLALPSNATLAVVPDGVGLPTDPDGAGLYSDVNGNGRKDFADVVLYLNRMAWIAANEPVAAFDYNGNGRIEFADVIWLFNHL